MMCYQFITIKCFITVEQPFRIHQVIFCLALLTTGFIPKFCTGILNYSPKYLFFFFFLLKVCPLSKIFHTLHATLKSLIQYFLKFKELILLSLSCRYKSNLCELLLQRTAGRINKYQRLVNEFHLS